MVGVLRSVRLELRFNSAPALRVNWTGKLTKAPIIFVINSVKTLLAVSVVVAIIVAAVVGWEGPISCDCF